MTPIRASRTRALPGTTRPRADGAWEAALPCPPHVKTLLRELVAGLRSALGDELAGVYLYGSLVFGDFDPETSDIDLLVAVRSDVDDAGLERLQLLHDAFARRHPDWNDRVDASYLSLDGLRSFKERESPLVVISPGEQLHATRTEQGWTMNWHVVREHGLPLLGPQARSVIASTSIDDFLAAVRAHMRQMPRYFEHSPHPGFPAYAVVTACRALYAHSERQQSSKNQAAAWAAERHPDWSDLIADALEWRRRSKADRTARAPARARCLEFVRLASGQLEVNRPTERSPNGLRREPR